MSKRTIVSIGCELPGGVGEFVPLTERRSLLDWDVIVFCPELVPFVNYGGRYYQGKPWLTEHQSAELRDAAEHWTREISEAQRAGKSVFVFLGAQEQVYIDTGRREYSGSGRNRQTTHLLEPFLTYQLLPSFVSFLPSEGRELRLADGDSFLSDYWRLFEERSAYKVLIESKVSQPLVLTRSGSRIAGALVRLKGSEGVLVLLPYMDLEAEEFFEDGDPKKDDEDETVVLWSPAAIKFGGQLRDALFRIDEAVRQGAPEPPPAWSADPSFLLPAEAATQAELLTVEADVARLGSVRENLKQRLQEEGVLRRLLYEKGAALEDAIARSLRLIGFEAAPYRDAKSEFDVVFQSDEGRLIGEAEGKDNKAVNIDKLRQLQMNLHEDLQREGVTAMAQGVLFGNAYRLTPPAERGEFFTEKVLTAAEQSGCVLVRTPDLFTVARYMLQSSDAEFARKCRMAIIGSKGQVAAFPAVPCDAPAGETGGVTLKSGP